MSTLSKKIIVQHKPIFDKKDALTVQKIIKSGWISEREKRKNNLDKIGHQGICHFQTKKHSNI